jgi:predicted secreted hydrolase
VLRRRLRVGAVLIALALLGLGGYWLWQGGMLPVNQSAEDWYEAETGQEILVQLPRDDAPHEDYMEWWYYNGHLDGEDGGRYSFHYTVFAINALATHTAVHVSFVDQRTGRHFSAQKRTSGNPSSGTRDGFEFVLGSWEMTGGAGKDRLRVGTPDFSFHLNLTETAPPVMQNGTGLLDFELAGSSYYYTRPRMDIRGSIKVGDRVERVGGVAWFDHQWGNFEVNQLGWDWFALQLDDGADIMLYQLFDADGLQVLHSGTIAQRGRTEVLDGEDFKVTVTDRWTSPRTRIEYPMGWVVEIPAHAIRLEVEPVLRESEFDGRVTSYKVYWEGAVTVSGSHGGRGFVEMSGYPPKWDAASPAASSGTPGNDAEQMPRPAGPAAATPTPTAADGDKVDSL